MKNTLAENMLRFGIKNLNESEVEKLQRLAEQADIDILSKLPSKQVANLSMSFKQSHGMNKPTVAGILGSYYLAGPSESNEYGYNGTVYGFELVEFGSNKIGLISVPVPSALGYFVWNSAPAKFNTINISAEIGQSMKYENDTAVTVANTISDKFNAIPLEVLRTIYAADRNKANYDARIAKFTNEKIRVALTGNAKDFFA
tara:strand:+ start:520 stop:1122 length:603 start_codon:yes stop_codon:yes gene_type:complete